MNKLVVDLLQQKGLGRWKVLKKRRKQLVALRLGSPGLVR
jgi:hypothetical protein